MGIIIRGITTAAEQLAKIIMRKTERSTSINYEDNTDIKLVYDSEHE
jgi:hypothetical protein